MSDSGILKELFNPNLLVDVGERSGRTFVKLKESGSDARLRSVEIRHIEKNAVVIKLDKCDPARTLFSCSKGEGRRCDYLIVTERCGRKFLLFIELKSGRVPGSVKDQFKGGECIVAYCKDVLDRFYDTPNFFDGYQSRFICFYKTGIAKKPTRPRRPSTTHSSPEGMWRYPNPVTPSIDSLL